MRLGVITASYPRWDGDYAGQFVAAHVQWLRAQGHHVEVVAMARNGLAEVTGASDADNPGIDGGVPDAFEAIAAGPRMARARGLASWLGHAAQATGGQAHEVWQRLPQWDAVCAHWLAPSALVAAVALQARLARRGGARVPLLAIAHGGDVYLLQRLRVLRAALALLCRADARFSWVSPALRDQALAACGPHLHAKVAARSIVSPMGLDTARFLRVAERRRCAVAARAEPDLLRLLVVARLVPIKGVASVLAALRQVRRACELVVVGDGPLRAALTAQARALMVEAPHHRVVFRGALAGPDVDDELVRADVVVVPSRVGDANGAGLRGEGMPLVALEALAAGVPLLHSGSGGLADLGWLGPSVGQAPHWSLTAGPGGAQTVTQEIAQVIEIICVNSRLSKQRATNAEVEHNSNALPLATELGWPNVGARLWSHWHDELLIPFH